MLKPGRNKQAGGDVSILDTKFAVGCAAALTLTGLPAAAQQGNWDFSVSAYLWANDTTVTTDTPRGEVESELSFSDAIKDLNFAFMGTVEARNGPWGIITDLLYFSLSSEGDSPAGVAFSGVEADSDMTVVSGYLAYRVYEDPKVAFDLGAGVRAFWINSDTSLIGATAPTETFSYDENFVDPVVAARLRIGFNEKWAGTVFLDAGGNGDSQTWQALATVDYGLSESWSLRGGYRYMKAEWDTDFGQSSLEFSGPVLGAAYRF